MSSVIQPTIAKAQPKLAGRFRTSFIVAWVFCVIFYFLQYAVRSAPSVMLPELKSAFALDTLGLSSLIGLYYYTYSTFALIAGAALDRWGGKYPITFGTALLAAGIALFGLGDQSLAGLGRGRRRLRLHRRRLSGGPRLSAPLSRHLHRHHAMHWHAGRLRRPIWGRPPCI